MPMLLDVPFRGNRNYLQGGDIYRAVAICLETEFNPEEIQLLRLKFNSLSYSALELSYWNIQTPEEIPKDTNGLLWFALKNGRRYEGCLVESGKPVESEIQGYEPEISASTEIEGKTAITSPLKKADLIEHVVFATKKLHNSVIPLDKGRWIVVDFKLSRFLEQEAKDFINITLENSYNDKITESSIYIGGERVGSILFLAMK